MSNKFFIIFLSFYLIVISSQYNKVEAFNFFDLIRKPLGQITESIFGWNPFKATNPLRKSLFGKTSIDDSDLIKAASNITNDTITKGYYSYGCNCIEFTCRCCSHVEINKFNLNNTGCLSLFYTNKNYTIETKYNIDEKTNYNQSISIVNPPNMCFNAPLSIEKNSNLCLKLYKLDARNNSLLGCADLIANSGEIELVKIKMGCFRMAIGSRHSEDILMSIYRNKKNFFYSYNNSTEGFDKAFNLNRADFNLATSFFKKIKKLDLPSLVFNYSPDKLVNNIYDTFFTGNSEDKK